MPWIKLLKVLDKSIFRFQQFSINQTHSAMKVGTDAVLIGAWSANMYKGRVLDVGSGTGVISLILAQKNKDVLIDAIEVEADAFKECEENFRQSFWKDRLSVKHISFTNYIDCPRDYLYEGIVSNPPYFSNDFPSQQHKRRQARCVESLSFDQLIEGASKLLKQEGVFSVIIPFSQEDYFVNKAKQHGLFLHKVLRIRGSYSSCIKRSLLMFLKGYIGVCEQTHMVLEIERGVYSDEYKRLVSGLYTGKGYRF